MKRTIKKGAILLLFITLLCVSLFGCAMLKVSLDFMVDGEVYHTLKTSGREAITLPENPEKEGDLFDGWFWDEGTWQRPFTVNSLLDESLTSDMRVYAKWASDVPVLPATTKAPATSAPVTEAPRPSTAVLNALEADDCYELRNGSKPSSFYQDKNYYYNIHYIGRVDDVPVLPSGGADAGSVIRYQGGDLNYEYSITRIEKTAVEDTLSLAFSHTTTIGVKVGAEAGVSLFGLIGGKVSVETGVEDSWTQAVERTTTVYREEISRWSESTSQSFSGAKPGFYRYTLFTSVDEYVVVRKSKSTGQIEKFAHAIPVGSATYAWEYSEDSLFEYDISKFSYTDADIPAFREEGEYLSQGDGTKDSPYIILNADDLKKYLSENGKYCVLGADIDMAGTTWEPIAHFSGTLDGQGLTIKNLSIKTATNGRGAGLIARLEGTIQNIDFESPSITVTTTAKDLVAGVVASELYGDGQILQCSVSGATINVKATETGTIATTNRYCIAGGIVGIVTGNGKVHACEVSDLSITGFAKRYDEHKSEGMNDAPIVYLGGVSGELLSGTLTDCTAKNVTLHAEAVHRISTAWSPYNNVWARVGMGGIAGHQVASKTTESGNYVQGTFAASEEFNPYNHNTGGVHINTFEVHKPRKDQSQNIGFKG